MFRIKGQTTKCFPSVACSGALASCVSPDGGVPIRPPRFVGMCADETEQRLARARGRLAQQRAQK
eukprot:6186070-Pleurochrysis_carterae.AAC.1